MQWREIFQVFVFPFYFIEFAFALLGAVQIWAHYWRDPQGTIGRFRHAHSLGHTVSVLEFCAIAGVNFAVDTATLRQAMEIIRKALMQ